MLHQKTAYVCLHGIVVEVGRTTLLAHAMPATSDDSGETEHEQNGVSEALASPLQAVQQALVLRKGVLRMRGKAIKSITLKRPVKSAYKLNYCAWNVIQSV